MNTSMLKKKPFCLSDEQTKWVTDTFESFSLEEKVGQLFCLIARSSDEEWIDTIFEVCQPGGIGYRPVPLEESIQLTHLLAKKAKIPLLIPANTESGGDGFVSDYGTLMSNQMGIAATGNPDFAKKLGTVCGREGSAIGGNWAFAPVIDIDYNFRNPITNTRTYGADPDTVKELGRAYVEAVQENGMAASIKHFPGDGRDERDQHLATTINDTDCDEWMSTYGKVYQESIDAGALTVMIGHIMHPAWSRKLRPGIKDEDIMPATLAPELMQDLLRGKLGFNGMIVTDATTMVGYAAAMSRKEAVPLSIAAGADMFLFTKNLKEDYDFMMDGVKNGVITEERLNDAVLRILATKAAMNLHKRELPTLENAKEIVGCEEHKKWAVECADAAVTLVKEQQGVLPLTPERYPNILLYPIETKGAGSFTREGNVTGEFITALEKEGFHVTVFESAKSAEGRLAPTTAVVGKYDAIVYIAKIVTKSNQTSVRIEWDQPLGNNAPTFFHDIPTIFVSLANPYHLIDVPRIKTFINAYTPNIQVVEAVVKKLMGKSEFKGKSPVDPFCGKWDTKL